MDRRGEFLYQHTGMGTYSAMLWQNLQAVAPDWDWLGLGAGAEKNTDDFFWEKITAEAITVPESAHLLFVPHNGIGSYRRHYGCPLVVTVHDVIPYILPETVGKGYLEIFLRQMSQILRESDHIIAVSQQTKKDLINVCGVNAEKITIIYEGKNESFRPLDKNHVRYCLRKIFGISEPYILYVGGFSGRKNVGALLEAFAKVLAFFPQLRLVLVGRPSPNRSRLKNLSSKLGIAEKVIWLEQVRADALPVLYNGATMLVYPSLYEGFGLPPLEAMACGVPVVAGNNSAVAEVVDKAGVLVDVSSAAEIAAAVISLLASPEKIAAAVGRAGLRRAEFFSWRRNAEKTLKIFEKVGKPADKT